MACKAIARQTQLFAGFPAMAFFVSWFVTLFSCMVCHDLDNSPDFHEEDAFEDVYWPEVEHYGKD
jgi:hypothetical protein